MIWNVGDHQVMTIGANEISASITGLDPSTLYKFRILGKNSIGKSAPSPDLLIKTDDEGEFAVRLVFCKTLPCKRQHDYVAKAL